MTSVTNYSPKTAILSLKHNHPVGNQSKALVDIELVLGSIKSYETRIGEWVNVMGYVGAIEQKISSQFKGDKLEVPVQAILLWSAGPLKLDTYEESLDGQKADEMLALKAVS